MSKTNRACPNCGSIISDHSKFCAQCGATVNQDINPEKDTEPERVTANIWRSSDGKLRWVYEYSLFRNPTILFLIWKIFFFIFLGMFIFMILLLIGEEGLMGAVSKLAPIFFGLVGGMLVLSTFAYCLYALIMGGKYCVLFEMNEKGVNHIQMQKQFKKAQFMSLLTALAGASSKNLTVAASGILSAGKQATYTKFSQVQSVKANRRREVIKLKSKDMVHNQVYAEKDDFDFVLRYILSHVKPDVRVSLSACSKDEN